MGELIRVGRLSEAGLGYSDVSIRRFQEEFPKAEYYIDGPSAALVLWLPEEDLPRWAAWRLGVQ